MSYKTIQYIICKQLMPEDKQSILDYFHANIKNYENSQYTNMYNKNISLGKAWYTFDQVIYSGNPHSIWELIMQLDIFDLASYALIFTGILADDLKGCITYIREHDAIIDRVYRETLVIAADATSTNPHYKPSAKHKFIANPDNEKEIKAMIRRHFRC